MKSVAVNALIHEKANRYSQILREIRIKESFYVKASAFGNWGLDNPPLKGALFHFVVEGTAQIEDKKGNFIALQKGDFVLLPKGNRHFLRSDEDANIENFESVEMKPLGENASEMQLGTMGERSILICGGLSFDPSWHPLIETLPSLLIQRASEQSGALHTSTLMEMMNSEVHSEMPGSEIVINRLSEVLVVSALRNWMIEGTNNDTSWIVALRDEFLGHSLVQIHTAPQNDWSVASLAKEAKMSRSVYAEKFHKLIGMPPMHYVTRIRMNLAADKLRQTTQTVERIALEVGYESAISFNRAFKRYWGEPPGRFKAHQAE